MFLHVRIIVSQSERIVEAGMCVRVFLCAYVCARVCVCAYVCPCMCVCVYVRAYICVCAYIYVRICVRAYMCARMYARMCVQVKCFIALCPPPLLSLDLILQGGTNFSEQRSETCHLRICVFFVIYE